MKQLEKTVFFPAPVADVFKFHTCIENMCRMLPENLNVEIVDAPCYVDLGDMVRLRVCLHAFSFRWETKIIKYKRNVNFVDTLKHGPFSYWKHEHLFESQDGGTLMIDRIEYRIGFGFLGGFASHFVVPGEVERIFARRHEKALQYFT